MAEGDMGDISELLNAWPFDPGSTQVRLIEAADGRPLLQVRVPLGVLQLEMSGRPDGRPSVLDAIGAGPDELAPEVCAAVRDEIHLRHQRAAALLAIDRFDEAERDVGWNLHAIDMLWRHGAESLDRRLAARLRPSVLTMRARTEVARAVRSGRLSIALEAVAHALADIRVDAEAGHIDLDADAEHEVRTLEALREALVPKLPASQRVELEDRLRAAIANENFELAAILRDELRLLG
ncbi:MAG: UvrB/UvrC motif-containing protein [Phycisphaerales bacterium]|nr:UvrB/UvrC motif-containing protein [Phycisphaerales bacterium]